MSQQVFVLSGFKEGTMGVYESADTILETLPDGIEWSELSDGSVFGIKANAEGRPQEWWSYKAHTVVQR